MNIDLYYDGVEIEKYHNYNNIKGFTTNISFMKEAGITDYNKFIHHCLKYNNHRPISFQVYEDEDEEIEKMTKKIFSIGQIYMATSDEYYNNIFVKIPIIKSNGLSNANIISKLHSENIQINVTCIYTIDQLVTLEKCFSRETSVIISLFSGKINDTGKESNTIVKYAVNMFKSYPNIKILWAACRTVYNIVEAAKQGAHIVTVPGSVLDRLGRYGQNLEQQCLDCVKKFKKDSEDIILI